MMIDTTEVLMSLRNEADRQAAFFERKNNEPLRDFWADLATLTHDAMKERSSLLIEKRERVTSPLPIKGCQQVQQHSNHNVIKAFR
jgi:hypothetical protein